MRARVTSIGTLVLAFFVATAFSPRGRAPMRHTVSSFTVHRGSIHRTFIPSATAPVSNAEFSLSLTVKGSLVDLSTGADVVNASGSIVSGTSASISNRQGGENTQIDVNVSGLKDKPAGDYRVRIRYAVETNGPDVVRIRLLERGEITSITRDPAPTLLGNTYTPLNQTSTYRVSGSGLAVATVDPSAVAGLNYTFVSRSNTSLVFTLRPTQAGRYRVSHEDFYDENLGHVPNASEENEMHVRYAGIGGETLVAVGAPTVTSIAPQPATGFGSITLSGSNLAGSGLLLSKIRYGHRYNAATQQLNQAPSASTTAFTRQPNSAMFMGVYDIASEPLELEFIPESSVGGTGPTPPPSFTMSVPFSAKYSPGISDVIASAEQATVSGVRVVRAGTVTFTGKYLFSPVASPAKGGVGFSTVLASSSAPTVVKLGTLVLTVAATRYVAPTASAEGRDSVRVTLPDPADNVVGQFHVDTDGGSAITSSTFVLATRPRVNLFTELTDGAPGERPIANQTLTRGRQYQITGTSLSVKSLTQLLQAGTVRIGSRAMTMQPTTDPVSQLRFLVPQDATTGALVVASLGGETAVGTFIVADPAAGSIATPRPTALTISPGSVAAGVAATGTLTLDNPGASVAGFTVAMSSSHPTVATVPATLNVPGSSGQFSIATTTVSAPQTVTISATAGGATQTRTFTVTPAVPSSFSLSAIDVVAGATVTGTLTFTAPPVNTSAAFTSSDAAAPVPASVPVSGNIATFSVPTTEAPAPRTVTISGSANGVAKSATMTITPLRILSVASSRDTIRVGQPATITANVNRGPAGNVALTVATSQPALLQFDEPSVRLGSGQTSGTIVLRLLTAPAAPTPVTITISRSVSTAGFGTITTSATRNVVIAP